MQMQVLCSAQQAHTRKQTDEAKIMIAMHVRNKNMADPASADLIFRHLQLGTFSTVDQEKIFLGL